MQLLLLIQKDMFYVDYQLLLLCLNSLDLKDLNNWSLDLNS